MLALGATGINRGTHFIASREAPVHDNIKKAIVAATGFETRLVMRALRNTECLLTNKGVERLIEIDIMLGPVEPRRAGFRCAPL